MLDKIQKKIAKLYCDGDLDHVKSLEEAKTCGDGLFRFLLIEAGDADGDPDEFQHMLESAIRQLQDLSDAMRREET